MLAGRRRRGVCRLFAGDVLFLSGGFVRGRARAVRVRCFSWVCERERERSERWGLRAGSGGGGGIDCLLARVGGGSRRARARGCFLSLSLSLSKSFSQPTLTCQPASLPVTHSLSLPHTYIRADTYNRPSEPTSRLDYIARAHQPPPPHPSPPHPTPHALTTPHTHTPTRPSDDTRVSHHTGS